MATFLQPTIEKRSNMVKDFLCSICEEKKLADYYCDSCVKFYCRKCMNMHNKFFTKHFPHGRGDMKKWPVAKKVEDFLLKCDVHKEENLEMFCEDHSQLCCRNCAFLNHRLCKAVVLLSDMVKNTSTDLKQQSATIQTILVELKKLQENQEASIQSVQSSYDEQLDKIQETRRKINAALDKIEKKTLKEMKDTLTKLHASLKNDVEKCATLRDELIQFRDAIQDISDKGKHLLSFIASMKCQDKIQKSEIFQKKSFVLVKSSIAFQPNNEIVKYLSKLSGLGRIEHSTQTLTEQGNPDHVIALNGKSEYDVSIPSDSDKCFISAICVLPDKQVLVADRRNGKVKLLDQQYQVVDHCDVFGGPWDMCQITPSEVAVTVHDRTTHEIQFITIINNQLMAGRKLQLQHSCFYIAHHHGDLFVTSGYELYKYTLSGNLVSKLHWEGPNTLIIGNFTVASCAASPSGDKLYVTNLEKHKLLTLAMDGTVLSSFTDPKLRYPGGLHVTPTGQVLVCGSVSFTILQVDSEGGRKLATLANESDGLQYPNSVCYSSNTASLIVGQKDNNQILVYRV